MKPIGPRRWALRTRTAFASIAIIVLAVACGTGGKSSAITAGSPATGQPTSAVGYSGCMRANGVPDYPDPGSGGQLPKGDAQQFGVSDSQLQTAERTCQYLLPDAASMQQQIQQCENAGVCPQSVVQQALSLMRQYAQCIRAHGVPDFPDPVIGSEGRPYFDVSGAGISYQFTHSPQFMTKDAECERQVGGSAGVPVPLG